MTEYAHVVDGVVRELYTPPDGFEIHECFFENIANNFIAVPDGSNVQIGWIYKDEVFSAPPPPTLTPSQKARAALYEGVRIVSASTQAISATYPLDQANQLKNMAIGNYIAVWSAFPNGGNTVTRFDVAGAPHVFPSTEVYMTWLRAIADYVAVVDLIVDTDSGELPEQPVEID